MMLVWYCPPHHHRPSEPKAKEQLMMMAVVVVRSSAARTNCDYIDYIDDGVINHDVALHPFFKI